MEVEDRPGGLHHILDILNTTGYNVVYVYAFVRQSGDNAINIFRFDNTDEAAALLNAKGFKIIDRPDLHAI